MLIKDIWVSQTTLNRAAQITEIVQMIKDGRDFPRITLMEDEDGEVIVKDGHHRLAAVRLAGYSKLLKSMYILILADHSRPKFGNIDWLIENCWLLNLARL